MIKHLTFFLLVAVPFVVFGDDSGTETANAASSGTGLFDFFSVASGFFDDIYTAVTVDAPSAFQRFLASVIEWATIIWLKMQIESIQFAWGVAKVILEDLQFGSSLNSVLSALPNDVKAFLAIIRFPDCIEILAGAHVTRFVMSII